MGPFVTCFIKLFGGSDVILGVFEVAESIDQAA